MALFGRNSRAASLFAFSLALIMLLSLSAGCGAKKEDEDSNGKKNGGSDLTWPTAYYDNQRTGRSPYKGPGTPEIKWTYQTTSSCRSSWVILDKEGNPTQGFRGVVVNLDGSKGTALWEFPAGQAEVTTCRTAPDGTIYASSGSVVYAISAGGKQTWTYDMGSTADDPALGDDGTVYVGSTGGKLVALSGEGKLDWEYQAPGDICSPSIDEKGNLYCAAATLAMYCIDAKGKKKWEFMPEGDLPEYEGLLDWANTLDVPSIGDDGTIYAGSYVNPGMTSAGQVPNYAVPQQSKIYAVSPQGQKKWEYAREDSKYAIHTPTIAKDGTLYAGTSCWKVLALDPDGKLVWEFDTAEETGECPSVYSPPIGKDGLLYAATTNSRIFCITPEGAEKWRFDAGNPWLPGPQGQPKMGGSNNFTPPAIGADGTLYSLLAEGKVFAFKTTGGAE